jgi:hypothetical protein
MPIPAPVRFRCRQAKVGGEIDDPHPGGACAPRHLPGSAMWQRKKDQIDIRQRRFIGRNQWRVEWTRHNIGERRPG